MKTPLLKIPGASSSLFKIISLLASLLLILIFTASCMTTNISPSPAYSSSGDSTDNNVIVSTLYDENAIVALYERSIPAIVKIEILVGGGIQLYGPFQYNIPRQRGQGSGFFIDNEGYIITNNHVIENAGNVTVTMYDGKITTAEIIGTDRQNDLALLKIDKRDTGNTTYLSLGDSNTIKPGQMAIAMGSPYGLDGSITVGIISGVGRSLASTNERTIVNVIQTDAAINPGNSGGPLLNSRGEVIGINTAIESEGSSIGFAVPVNTVKSLLPALKKGGEVKNAWLGISALAIDRELQTMFSLPVDKGVYIIKVFPDSPAEKAGLVESGTNSQGQPDAGGDIVTAVDNNPVGKVDDILAYLNSKQPGDNVVLNVYRDKEKISITVELGEWPEQLDTPGLIPPIEQ